MLPENCWKIDREEKGATEVLVLKQEGSVDKEDTVSSKYLIEIYEKQPSENIDKTRKYEFVIFFKPSKQSKS